MTVDQGDRVTGHLRRHLEYLLVVQAAEPGQYQTDAEQETKVTHPVYHEGLQAGIDGRLAGKPETDQQIRHQAYCLPAEKQLQEVVAHHQHQHREGE